jgi:hypothetical protein
MSSIPPPPPTPPTITAPTARSVAKASAGDTAAATTDTGDASTLDLPPPDSEEGRSNSPSRQTFLLAVLLGVAGIAVGAIMTLLWMSVQTERDDAIADRDQAVAARDAAAEANNTTQNELIAANDALTTAEGEIARLEVRIEDLEAELAATPESSSVEGVAELEAEVATLTEEVERLTAENAALMATIEEAEIIPAPETESEPESAPAATTTGAEFDASTTPEFARYMGEVLSSRNGSSRLSATQSTCFGTEVINDIGLDALGAGLHNARTSEANNNVVGAMQRAAQTCGIDQTLIFN